jgi:phosphopantothenate-cysteine ligase
MMKHMDILITAGGTDERIDRVRSITNMSTGRLSRSIAEILAAREETERILYVCGEKALRPRCEKVSFFPVGSVAELAEAVTALCRDRQPDAIVHAMAVSDFTVRMVSDCDAMAESVLLQLGAAENAGLSADAAAMRAMLRGALTEAKGLPRDGKISSDAEDPVIFLQRAPKVLSMLRGLAPRAVIIGFKLLDGVTEEYLVETAHGLLRKNDCDFVLANDLQNIGGDKHIGHLVGRDGSYVTYGGKEAIARGIAEAIAGGRKA